MVPGSFEAFQESVSSVGLCSSGSCVVFGEDVRFDGDEQGDTGCGSDWLPAAALA